MLSSEYIEYCDENEDNNFIIEIEAAEDEHSAHNICDICEKTYTSKSGLRNHVQSAHREIRYPCDQCLYQAKHKIQLKKHIQSVHEKLKYSCNICDKQFTHRGYLKTHI